MKRIDLNLPTFGFVVATRAMIGAGIGLLVAGRLAESRRRTVGIALLAAGAASTIPAIREITRNMRSVPARA